MMADFAPIQETDLETPPRVPGGLVGDGSGDLSKYEPVNDNDLAPNAAPGTPQRGFRGLPFSQGAINRLNQGESLTPVISKLVSGAATGYGDSYNAMTADDFQKINDFLPQGDTSGVGGALRFAGRALMADVARIKAGTLSLFPAAVGGISQAAGEASKQAGGPDISEDVEHDLNIMASDAGINMMLLGRGQYAEATRIVPNPTGGLMDQRIGPVPDHVEAAQQAATVATHYGIPDAAPTIKAAYDQGVLPAEIFHDAKTDPTILPALVEGKVPEAYPVQDWTGAEMSPEGGAKATAEPGSEAQGVASSPSAPIPASRLPAGAPRPVIGTGDIKPRGLSESTEAAAINKDLSEGFGDLPTYQAVKDTDQGALAAKFLNDDPEAAMEVAMGTKAAPKGLLPEAAYVAVKNRAVAEGDVDTIRNLATQSTLTQQATTMGQRISYLRNVNPENDPVAAIQQVQEARAAALKAKGIDVAANTNQAAAEYAPLRAAARAPKGADAWQKFMTSIRCAE